MLIKKIKQLWPLGLAGKLIKSVVILIFILGFLFMVLSNTLISLQKRQVALEESKKSEFVESEYIKSMAGVTNDALLQLITWSSDKIDDEFWIFGHDLSVLRTQVEDVYRHPENYERVPVEPPLREKNGQFSLQLLYPNDTGDADPKTMEMVERLANLAPMMQEVVVGNEGYTLDCYIATPDGITLAMDNFSGSKVDEFGNPQVYDPRTRPWFQGAVKNRDIYFSSRVHSFFYDVDTVVFGIPCYVDGELVAVLQGSSKLGVIEKKLAERNMGSGSFSILVSHEGQLVCSTRTEGELKVSEDYEADIRDSVNPELRELINCAISGKTDVDIATVDGERYYAGHAPIDTCGWAMISFVPEKEVLESSSALIGKMDEATDNMLMNLTGSFRVSTFIMAIVLLMILQIASLMVSRFAKKSVAPINQMTEAVTGFVGEDMDFEMKDIYKTGDEIEVLADAFDTMSVKMKEYVREIVENTAEKERIGAEMEAASQIQLKMLPRIEPDFKDKPGYELFARMVPAKEVGGDLYDFFYLDEDHLVLTIGDVSGKGITAALFMALSKQMLKSQMLLQGGDVVKAVNESNLRLCEESADGMFVTVWLGVLTLSTGELNFVDAGHMYAAVKRAHGEFVIEPDKHGIVVGGVDFAKYTLNTMKLQAGDVVYLYTDGVTEARNAEEKLFEVGRLLNALNEVKDMSVEEIDNNVRSKVDEFANGAEQYDDITTLCLRYTGDKYDK